MPRNSRNSKWVLIKAYLTNKGIFQIYVLIFTAIHIILFIYVFIKYTNGTSFKGVVSLVGFGIPIAKSAAMCLSFDSLMILFPVCNTLLAKLRLLPIHSIFPLHKNIHFHRYFGYSILVFTFIHVMAHYWNYLALERVTIHSGISFTKIYFSQFFPSNHLPSLQTCTSCQMIASWYAWMSGPGVTGQIGTIALFLMVTSSANAIRKKQFELFWYAHHLFLVYFGSMLVHGAFCFVKADKEPYCNSGGTFWMFALPGLACYTFERLFRELRGRIKSEIVKIIIHPANVMELHFSKKGLHTKAGDYILLNCPAVSAFQWHPFTLTSCPEESFFSVHIRIVGDWTRRLARACSVDSVRIHHDSETPVQVEERIVQSLPWVMIDGPYGSSSEEWLHYSVIVSIASGIGVTPFASILKSLLYQTVRKSRNSPRVKKVYFIWICRETTAFEWFRTLLADIEQDAPYLVSIQMYFTGSLKRHEINNIALRENSAHPDAVTGLHARTYYGRPQWPKVFSDISNKHRNMDIGVFFCGPDSLSKKLYNVSVAATNHPNCTARFFYHKGYAYSHLYLTLITGF